MKDTTLRGDIAEFQIAAALIRHGNRLLRPLRHVSRSDRRDRELRARRALRVEPARNGQRPRVRPAAEFVIT